MKITTKQLVQTALHLTICIVSQYFKNLSVYITGPIVNLTIILAVLSVGLWSGLLLSIIAPVTAFFFTGSPIMAAIPLMFPAVMAGNAVLAIFMGVVIVLIILPIFGDNIASKLPKPEALPVVLATAKVTFSITQLTTALIGSALAYVIWMPLKKYLKAEN